MITFNGKEIKQFDDNSQIEFIKYPDLFQANLTLNGEKFEVYFKDDDKERLKDICKQQ